MVLKIALTGGPGSGKTSVLESIDKYYTSQGYKVMIIDETATYLINKGIKPFGDESLEMMNFEELVLLLQLAKEEVLNRWIKMLDHDKLIIVYDRGVVDASSFITIPDFMDIIENRLNLKTTFLGMMERYDLVLNLVSSKEFYTLENNKARSENPDEALEVGRKTLHNWLGHQKLKIVLPKDTIDEKIEEVLTLIDATIKNDKAKIQEKFLVNLNPETLNIVEDISSKMKITQTYLKCDEDMEKRLRIVYFNDEKTYYLTIYKIINKQKVKIYDSQINEEEYLKLLNMKDDNYRTIEKIRYYFSYENEYLSLDVLDDDTSILEINDMNKDNIIIPPFIDVIRNVSNDQKYHNRHLAKLKRSN